MKHPAAIALWMVSLFLAAQLVGLFVLQKYMVVREGVLYYQEVPSFFGLPMERPDISPGTTSSLIIFGLIIGTLLVFLVLRLGYVFMWKFWYGAAVVLCLNVAFAGFLNVRLAGGLALLFGLWKLLKPNIIVHNLTEVLVHSGLAVIFVPLLSVKSMLVLYFLVAVYDAYAVWKSKHMVKLAKFQARSGIFAGLLLPYHVPHRKIFGMIAGRRVKLHKFRTAILGGGDVAFPLFFAGVVQQEFGMIPAFVVAVCTAASLYCLLAFGRKDRFYPAIPFLLIGSLLGLGISFLL